MQFLFEVKYGNVVLAIRFGSNAEKVKKNEAIFWDSLVSLHVYGLENGIIVFKHNIYFDLNDYLERITFSINLAFVVLGIEMKYTPGVKSFNDIEIERLLVDIVFTF